MKTNVMDSTFKSMSDEGFLHCGVLRVFFVQAWGWALSSCEFWVLLCIQMPMQRKGRLTRAKDTAFRRSFGLQLMVSFELALTQAIANFSLPSFIFQCFFSPTPA